MSWSVTTASSSETEAFGRFFAQVLRGGDWVLLQGDLGTGKTTFVRGATEALGGRSVKSPSFSLVNQYEGRLSVAHADLYRLETADSRDLGLDEYEDDGWVLMVEWPERLAVCPRSSGFRVLFRCFHGEGVDEEPDRRTISVEPLNDESKERLAAHDADQWRGA
ncbi:MAG: tRNA (adenosine(37)-N6)-threonylcarbamoyltransferase complex ATPase subunit type 1 TsaE [Dethiosulfovibrio peptidovorans]|nr:MAG: tRNA (adenosine(37)-N6)-threonylcarbamoyltransferase complex ATPase subunit type 1 TsaE [Dethiosulfovibrio peptidovorans]